MAYSRQDVEINTQIKDKEKVKDLLQPIYNFATKHGAEFDAWFDGDECLIVSYEINGRTPSYCKGVMFEIKQMLEDVFNCKAKVLLNGYSSE